MDVEKIREAFEPCPFCGVEDGDHDEGVPFIHGEQFDRQFRIVCSQCGARSGARNSPREATEAWNTRAALSIIDPEAIRREAVTRGKTEWFRDTSTITWSRIEKAILSSEPAREECKACVGQCPNDCPMDKD